MPTKPSPLARALLGETPTPEPPSRSPAARRARGQERLPGGFAPKVVTEQIAALARALGTGPLGAVAVAVREACERRGIEVGVGAEKKDRHGP